MAAAFTKVEEIQMENTLQKSHFYFFYHKTISTTNKMTAKVRFLSEYIFLFNLLKSTETTNVF